MSRYAAVDIGSNSIRMMAADLTADGQLQVLAEDRRVNRLGSSVFLNGVLAEEAITAVCDDLTRMAALFATLSVAAVRAVATSAVRDARNQADFIARTQAALGAPVEVISGQEEARLIHLGVRLRWPHPGRFLIVDVGGGSTEIILVEDGELVRAFSKPLGAVRLKEVFLRHDPPLARELHQMQEYIDERLDEPLKQIGANPLAGVIATSATAGAIICAVNGVPRARRDQADRLEAKTAEVRSFYESISQLPLAERRKLPGIGPRRAELIVAGCLVFLRALERFGQTSLAYSIAGVREGVIADLAARGHAQVSSALNPDQRRTVEEMAVRYGVQAAHARQVAALARDLFVALQSLHKLAPLYGKLLEAAAYLHDIGHFVSDTSHHKHSHYLVVNSDLPGFTGVERSFIADLCRYHRKSMPAARHPQYQALHPEERRAIVLLVTLLRLADNLDRGHEQRIQQVKVALREGAVIVTLESQSGADLETWAAENITQLFLETYGVPLLLETA